MRLKLKRPAQHRANAADRIVQTPTMARRPLAANPATTQMLPVIRDAGFAITREMPRVDPAALPTIHPHTPLTPISGHPAPSLVLDAVRAAELELDATQVLPVVRALHDGPPSQFWERMHAAESEQDQPDVDVRTPEQINAHADALATAFDNHMAELEQKARRRDDAIEQFAKRWQHDDAHWAEVARVLAQKENASDAGQLTSAYVNGGTELALYKVEELAHEIAQRALTGSAVTR